MSHPRLLRCLAVLVVIAAGALPVLAAPVESPRLTAPCADLVADGGFEVSGWWTYGVTPRPAVQTMANPHSGSWSLQLGITDPAQDTFAFSSVRQRITIPPDSASATLRFWYWPATMNSGPIDAQEALVLDPSGTVRATVLKGLSNAQMWIPVTFDMTPFIGSTVDIYFNVISDGQGARPTWMYLDDVSLTTCGTGTVLGTVICQGRSDQSGTILTASGLPSVGTSVLGSFAIADAPAGTYSFTAQRPGYLAAQLDGVTLLPGAALSLPQVFLRGGDADNDGTVGVSDLVIVGSNYLMSPPMDTRADLNGDGVVNLVDLVMVGGNWGQTAPQPWVLGPSAMNAATTARVWLDATLTRMEVGETRTVDIRTDDVQNLFGADIEVHFDRTKVQVEDSDPSQAGVQIANGPFLVPNGEPWFRYNQVDNPNGIISYSGALIAPTGPGTPVSGSGVLATITFRAIADGDATLTVSYASLEQLGAVPIPRTVKNGGILVGPSEKVFLPIVSRH